jgi:teichoic acid transport system permease protein
MPTAEPTGTMDAAALAERYGLTKSSLHPPLRAYIRELWGRRKFVLSYATARTYAMYAGARLGSVWQVLAPLLNAAVYYLAFGVLLGTKNGIDNYVAFLLSGIFVFTYTQRSMTEGSRSLALMPGGIAIVWSVVALVGGFTYFWRAEDRYGRG